MSYLTVDRCNKALKVLFAVLALSVIGVFASAHHIASQASAQENSSSMILTPPLTAYERSVVESAVQISLVVTAMNVGCLHTVESDIQLIEKFYDDFKERVGGLIKRDAQDKDIRDWMELNGVYEAVRGAFESDKELSCYLAGQQLTNWINESQTNIN